MIGHGPNPQQHEMWHGHILDSLVGALYIQILSDSTVLLSVSVYHRSAYLILTKNGCLQELKLRFRSMTHPVELHMRKSFGNPGFGSQSESLSITDQISGTNQKLCFQSVCFAL